MPAFVILGNYSEQRMRNIRQLADLRHAAEQWTTEHGGRVIANYTTFGPYDFVFIIELPTAEVALEGSMTFGSQGEVRTLTMLAMPTSEAEKIAQRIPQALASPRMPAAAHADAEYHHEQRSVRGSHEDAAHPATRQDPARCAAWG